MGFLRIQDPDDPSAPMLLEEIVAACRQASAGGAMFGYARVNGVDLLLSDPEFQALLQRGGRFELIVGIDGVTDIPALNRLEQLASRHKTLSVRVFFHDRRATTFHPKLCWFTTTKGGIALVGSGNLTFGGLTKNWEAFTVHVLDPPAAAELKKQWDAWVLTHKVNLRQTNDADVRARASKNIVTVPDRNVQDDRPVPRKRVVRAARALLAEIPKASVRWNQANVDKASFVDFFQADDPNRRLTLWQVRDDGSLADVEVRPGVSVKSRNFRVELRAAAGLAYPSAGKPIGAFVRTGPREFLYMLLMPGTAHHSRVAAILERLARSPARQMKRLPLATSRLRREWPTSPLWRQYGGSPIRAER